MSEHNIHYLEAGCELWFVPTRGLGQPEKITLGKIGRRWADIAGRSRRRVDLSTLRVKSGDFDCGQCYLSREAYEATTWMGQAWRVIRDNIDWSPPDNITPEQVEQIAFILGIVLPPHPTQGGGGK